MNIEAHAAIAEQHSKRDLDNIVLQNMYQQYGQLHFIHLKIC